MERVVARETPADHRCPYCHDALAGGEDLPADDLVECDGCRTRHHRACIEELGRCTIRGCERSLHVEPRAEPAEGSRRSAVQREVQARLRERARSFVQANARPVGEIGGRAAVEAAVAAARAAERANDPVVAAADWHEVARRLTLSRPEDLEGLHIGEVGTLWTLRAPVTANKVADVAEAVVRHAEHLLDRRRWAGFSKGLGIAALVALSLVVVIGVTLGVEAALAVAVAAVGALGIGGAMGLMVVGLVKGTR